MAQLKQSCSARTSLTATGLATLAAATYVASSVYTPNVNQPLDVVVEVTCGCAAAPTGNQQLLVFMQESLDGTNFRSGPISGTTTTHEPNLRLLGAIPMAAAGVIQMATFSIGQALGYVPYAFKIICKNDLGVALTSGTLWTSEISATSV